MFNSKTKYFFTHNLLVRTKLFIYLILISVLLSPSAFSVIPFVDTGKLLRGGEIDISAHTIIHQKEETGFNVMLALDHAHWSKDSLNMRYFLGGGTTLLHGGAFLKWVPFPDYKWQPAIGISNGIEYHFSGVKTHFVKLHIRPFISKEFNTPIGVFTPYLASPVSIDIKNFTQVQIPVRLAFGVKSEMIFIHFRKLFLYVELSADLTGATPFYASLGVLTYWTDRGAAR